MGDTHFGDIAKTFRPKGFSIGSPLSTVSPMSTISMCGRAHARVIDAPNRLWQRVHLMLYRFL
jgi:hypothetical protein